MNLPRTHLSRLRLLAPCLLLLAGCQAPVVGGGTRGVTPTAVGEERVPRRGYDVEHYAIDLVLHPGARTIEGTCRIRLAALQNGLRELDLDLQGLAVSSVQGAGGGALAFAQRDGILRVQLAEPLVRAQTTEVEVRYGGAPVTGLWFSGQDSLGQGPTQVFTHGQPAENSGWFPCYDHPSDRATTELRVSMPIDWVAVAAGRRVEVTEEGGRRVEHWAMDSSHPTYLTTLVAGEFEVSESEWDGIPLLFLVEPQFRDWAAATFGETDEVLQFLSDVTGVRYPYPKYSQACVDNFPWGGMENVSATTLSPLTLADELGHRDGDSTNLVAHEAAHQWFGDLISTRNWSHLWLSEGFATYFAMLYTEATQGVDALRIAVRDAQQRYLEEDARAARRPTVWDGWSEPRDLMDARIYEGGAVRLHLLRFVMGDAAFWAGIRNYATRHAGTGVLTEDFRRAMEEASGEDLSLFFEQWIYGPGHPDFELDWSWEPNTRTVQLHVRQLQGKRPGTPRAFRVPVDVEVRDEAGLTLHRIQVTRREEVFELPAASAPLYVIFDKGGWIPKTVRWRGERIPELLVQAYEDDDAGGRRAVLRALGERAREKRERSELLDNQTIVTELAHRLRTDPVVAVRAAAAEALGQAGGFEAQERLMAAAREDDSALVRTAALEALGEFGIDARIGRLAEAAFEDHFSWETMGAAAGLLARANPRRAYRWMTEKLFIDSPHDRLRGMLFRHLGTLDNQEVGGQLRRWVRDESVHPSARAVAVSVLGGLPLERNRNSQVIAELLEADSFHLRGAAEEALRQLNTEVARDALAAHAERRRAALASPEQAAVPREAAAPARTP